MFPIPLAVVVFIHSNCLIKHHSTAYASHGQSYHMEMFYSLLYALITQSDSSFFSNYTITALQMLTLFSCPCIQARRMCTFFWYTIFPPLKPFHFPVDWSGCNMAAFPVCYRLHHADRPKSHQLSQAIKSPTRLINCRPVFWG